MIRTQKYAPLPCLVMFLASACSGEAGEPASVSPTGELAPGAVQNADGTVTNADGSVVDPDTGTVISPPTGSAGQGADTTTPGQTTADTTTTTATETGTTDGTDTTGTTTTTMDTTTETTTADCTGETTLANKRIVRLTFNQVANSIRALLGEALADEIAVTYELTSPYERTFPPLNNPREGSVVIDSQWQTGDAIAQTAAGYVLDNFGTVTGCGDAPTEECARTYANSFAEGAYRRPLSEDEQTAFSTVFDDAITNGASIQEATRYSVYAALSTPQFLYRTEFGADPLAAGDLSQYEIASMLSYFVTDGPPDQALYDAAAQGTLTSPDELAVHVDRLLQTPEAQENLQSAMYSYFGISTLSTIIIDPAVAPQFNEGLRASMMRETELFINDTLWNGSVADLLLSRESYVNEGLANVYGITFPPAGSTPDADGFAKVTLPDNRSGILTQPGYLTTRSSPDEPSVVRRGLLVNASLLCAENPPFPEAQAEAIEEVVASIADLTQREQAEYRAGSPECAGCHTLFDAYGLGLDNFDVIGAFREADEQGRPIDPTVELPPTAGGATVASPAEMAAELANSGTFTRCVSKNLLSYALAEGSNISAQSCATQQVVDEFAASDQSFSALVRAVARSSTFISRAEGAAQ